VTPDGAAWTSGEPIVGELIGELEMEVKAKCGGIAEAGPPLGCETAEKRGPPN
jgi:hypothetical protein